MCPVADACTVISAFALLNPTTSGKRQKHGPLRWLFQKRKGLPNYTGGDDDDDDDDDGDDDDDD